MLKVLPTELFRVEREYGIIASSKPALRISGRRQRRTSNDAAAVLSRVAVLSDLLQMGITLRATLGRSWGTGNIWFGWKSFSEVGDDIEAKSNGASMRWDSQRSRMYLSSQPISRANLAPTSSTSDDLVPFSNTVRSGSRYLGSLFRNPTMTFSPRTLQKVA